MALAADFPPRTRAHWEELAAAVVNRRRPPQSHLSPADVAQALRTRLAGDLEVDPLYLRADAPAEPPPPGQLPFTRGADNRADTATWDVRQLHDDPDVAATSAAVAADLSSGGTSLWLHLGTDGIAADDLATVLAGVDLAVTPVAVSSWDGQDAGASALLELLTADGRAGARGSNLGIDPVAATARTGASPVDALLSLSGWLERAGRVSGLGALVVDTRPHHEAGASAADEVAAAVATGVAYLRALEGGGVDPTTSAGHLQFRVAATADQFLTAATLRALRTVWARVLRASGVPEQSCAATIHAVTSSRMLSRDDPYVNVLRGTLACVGACLGGAQAITVLPFDTVSGLPEPFSRRLARNTHTVLAQESHLAAVADPAGGSWYVEQLTNDLAAAAWQTLRQIESGGGMVEVLGSGWWADKLDARYGARAEAVATRSIPLTGVSMFPLLTEQPLVRRPRQHVGQVGRSLPVRRDAAAFEVLRDRSRGYADDHGGAPPTIVVAALGQRRDFGARATFVLNLLAAGGVRGLEVPITDADAAGGLVAAQLDPDAVATVPVVLASSPSGYARHGARALAALREAGVGTVLVAGRSSELETEAAPTDATAEPSGAGPSVDGEIRDGMNVVAVLSDLLDRLGAPPDPGADSRPDAPIRPDTSGGAR